MKIINTHEHLWNHDGMTVEALLDVSAKFGISETWLSNGFTEAEWDQVGDKHVEQAFTKYPNQIRGMGFIHLGIDNAQKVKQFKDRGFWGLKCIFPTSPYDDPAHDEIWAIAQELKMPVLFHACLSISSINAAVRKFPFNPRWTTPDRLLRVALLFPDMIMIIAHLGNYHMQEACDVARLANVYLDTSGAGDLKHYLPKSAFDAMVYWRYAKNKLLWGSDNHYKFMANQFECIQHFLNTTQLSEENIELMWHGNAEKIIHQITGTK